MRKIFPKLAQKFWWKRREYCRKWDSVYETERQHHMLRQHCMYHTTYPDTLTLRKTTNLKRRNPVHTPPHIFENFTKFPTTCHLVVYVIAKRITRDLRNSIQRTGGNLSWETSCCRRIGHAECRSSLTSPSRSHGSYAIFSTSLLLPHGSCVISQTDAQWARDMSSGRNLRERHASCCWLVQQRTVYKSIQRSTAQSLSLPSAVWLVARYGRQWVGSCCLGQRSRCAMRRAEQVASVCWCFLGFYVNHRFKGALGG